MNRVAEIQTVQGIGDIFWVYQLLAPHYDRIAFDVLITADDPVQKRAAPFIELLPKVWNVGYKIVPGDEYVAAAKARPLLTDLQGRHPTRDCGVYAVNNYLEGGMRLDAIGAVEWGVQFNVAPEPYLHPGQVCMFVSGSSRHFHDKFSPQQWAELYAKLNINQGPLLIGAEYDRWMLDEVYFELETYDIAASTFIARPAEQVVRILRGAKLMIGFQSGLNVIANNYGVPVIMIDFNHLRPMSRTWCRPGIPFAGFVFEDGVDAIAQGSAELIRGLQ